MKYGFTLVELSIVIVIIGLLIGGILVGQSLIDSIRITAAASQIQQFDIAVANFSGKYRYLASDAPAFGGDGDRIIDITSASAYDDHIDIFKCELSRFWATLFPEQYVRGNCGPGSGTKAVWTGENKNVPASKIGKKGSYFMASAGMTACCTVNKSRIENYYTILDSTQAQTSNYSFKDATIASDNSPLKPQELYALDLKIDDGIANNGAVRSGRFQSAIRTTLGPFSQCSTTTNYNLTNYTYSCTPLIRIGGTTGHNF